MSWEDVVDYPTPHKSGKADYQSTFKLYGAMKVRSLFLQIKYRCYEALIREGTLFVEPYRSCSKWRGLNSLLKSLSRELIKMLDYK